MSTTTNMSITLPDVSSTAGPTWATNLNTGITTIDAHDHTTGKGVKVTPAGLNINATLEMNSNDLTEINAAAFDNQAAIDTTARSLQVVNGELYFRDNASNSVQITNNGALSALSFAEIGGDYATGTAAIVYSTSTKFFTFTQSAGVGAKLSIGSIAINDAAGGANAGTLAIPALSGAATYTLPSATSTISTLALAETLTNKTISAPVLSGSVTGTYTLAGTPTLTSPAINTATIAGGTATGLTKLGLRSSGDDFDLVIAPQSNLTAERNLNITTGDAARAVTLSGDLTVESASLINQDLTSDSTAATFAELTTTTHTKTDLIIERTGSAGVRIAGHVIQVVSAQNSAASTVSATGTPELNDIVTAAITPKSTSSKILILGNAHASTDGASATTILRRDTTIISVGDAASNRLQGSGGQLVYTASQYIPWAHTFFYWDAPASVSAITYRITAKTNGSLSLMINRSHPDTDNNSHLRTVSNIILLEIAQ